MATIGLIAAFISGYVIPGWPGLYLPWKDPKYLFYPSCTAQRLALISNQADLLVSFPIIKHNQLNYISLAIWRYTLYWSLLLTGLAFFLCGTWACLIFSRKSRKHFKYAIWLPVGYCLLGGIISLVTGTVIGMSFIS